MTQRRTTGFTLVELMLVMLFLAIIGVYTWTYLKTTLNTQKTIEQKISIQQLGLSVMSRLQEDISQVFLVESYQRLSFFNGEARTLTFSTLSHDAPNPEDRECEEAEVTYSLDSDPESTETQVLLRKEVPFLDGEQEKNDTYQPLIVARQISSLEFAYSDDGVKYVDEWNTANSDHLNKLPKLVRIQLTIKDPEGREEYFESLVDLPMTENLNVTAQNLGMGGSGSSSKGNSKNQQQQQPDSLLTPTTPRRGGNTGGVRK
ncbi:MAG: type II secretion system protein GspJ [Bdellovibrionota bacterium]